MHLSAWERKDALKKIPGCFLLPGMNLRSDPEEMLFPGNFPEFNFFNFGIGSKYMNLKRITPYLVVGVGGTLASPSVGGSSFAIVLPMGVGVKYKWKERLNLGLEFTMRKSFGDGLDGLSDLNGINHSFAKNTDWYSVLMVSVTYEFGKRCKVCHYVE